MSRRHVAIVVTTLLAGGSLIASRPLSAAAAAPREVLLLRNAEEPKGTDVHLNDAGKARAKSLVIWVTEKFGKPDVLIGSSPTDKSRRAIETLDPLAAALKLKIQDDVANEDYKKMTAKLLSDSQYAGKRIVICWQKGNLANIALALGVKQPPPWPDTQYDHAWRLVFAGNGVTLQDMKQ